MSFSEVGIELEFKGENEKAFVTKCNDSYFQIEIGKEVLAIDPQCFRPTEVDLPVGDAGKAKEKLEWECRYGLKDLVEEMMASDLKLIKQQ